MAQYRVGQTEVALGILEINRIDLVRHGRGPDLSLLRPLLEVAQGNIAPYITIKINKDGVGAGHRVKQLSQTIVRLDLNGVRVELKANRLDKAPGKFLPVKIRVSGQMCVVIAHRAVDLALQPDFPGNSVRASQAVYDVGKLLAHGRRRSRLPMGAREHRLARKRTRKRTQLVYDARQCRLHDLAARAL